MSAPPSCVVWSTGRRWRRSPLVCRGTPSRPPSSSLTGGEYFTHYGHDYWSGSGGGSGYAYGLSTPLEGGTGDRFVDLEPIAREPDASGELGPFSATIFFIAGGLIDMSYFIGGGVSVSYADP